MIVDFVGIVWVVVVMGEIVIDIESQVFVDDFDFRQINQWCMDLCFVFFDISFGGQICYCLVCMDELRLIIGVVRVINCIYIDENVSAINYFS